MALFEAHCRYYFMKHFLLLFALVILNAGFAQDETNTKTIHVYVALCDNANQGIVPVPAKLGNGQDARNNLYWGAMYGVKSYFKRSKEWTLVKTEKDPEPHILERVLFKHATTNTYLLAEAYDGKYIKQAITDFLEASAGNNTKTIKTSNASLTFGGGSDLVCYVGHDGLMEFDVSGRFQPTDNTTRDAIILACISKDYFKPYLEVTGANPLVWSTGLMSPEAYSLKWAIDGWILNETDAQIRERAAKAYNHYQKCGMRGARNLLVTGY